MALITIWFVMLVNCHAQPASGTIRVWGSAQMVDLVERWERGFVKHNPGITFDNHLYGAASAIAGLYTGAADISFSREIWPIETLAFEQVLGYQPTAFEVATGSFDVPTKSDSLDIFVHRDNPISRLTLGQLDTIFRSGGARVWGDIGAQQEWANRPIHEYGFKLDNAGMMLFSNLVMKGVARWNANLRDFGNAAAADGSRIDAGRLILDALAKDPGGIAIANAHYARPEVKMLPIAAKEGGPYVAPGRETVADRTYPLTRRVYAFVNQPPGRPRDPPHNSITREFLLYVLSREGRQDVVAEGDYLPLPSPIATEQSRALQ